MRADNRPPQALTPTERGAERLRTEERRNQLSQCHACVNGYKVFERWVCEADLTWPKCKGYCGGYHHEPNPVPRET